MFSLRIVFVFIFIILLTACQGRVKSQVTSYRDADFSFPLGSVEVLPSESLREKLGDNDREFDYFRRQLQARFEKAGYQTFEMQEDSSDTSLPKYKVFLNYHVERREVDKSNPHIYAHGVYGRAYTRGGVVIADPYLTKKFEYKRELSLRVEPGSTRKANDSKTGREKKQPHLRSLAMYRATSVGQCEHLNVVFDEMLEAIFSSFQQKDGSIRNVYISGEASCP